MVTLYAAFQKAFTPLSMFQTVTAFVFLTFSGVWLQTGIKAANLEKTQCGSFLGRAEDFTKLIKVQRGLFFMLTYHSELQPFSILLP